MADDPAWVAYTAFGLSIVSTFRPELDGLRKRVFSPVRPSLEQMPSVEVGFNFNAAYVKAAGVIMVANGSIVVRKMRLTIAREFGDAARRAYEAKWYLATHGDPSSISSDIRIPTPFAVDDEKPEPYMVFFAHDDSAKRVQRAAQDLADAWKAFQSGATLPAATATGQAYVTPFFVAQNPWTAFKTQPGYADAVAAFERELFWVAGKYRLDLTVETVAGPAPAAKPVWFALSANDAAHLHELTDLLAASVCGIADPKAQWPSISADCDPDGN